jgi:hypothetical protein
MEHSKDGCDPHMKWSGTRKVLGLGPQVQGNHEASIVPGAVTHIPPMPQGPRASGRLHLRFEDVTQDGRLVLESLPTALGPTVWRAFL